MLAWMRENVEVLDAQAFDGPAVITLRVTGLIGAELYPAVASRSFELVGVGADATSVVPLSVLPTELGWREQRRVALTWLKEAQRRDLARIETPLEVRT